MKEVFVLKFSEFSLSPAKKQDSLVKDEVGLKEDICEGFKLDHWPYTWHPALCLSPCRKNNLKPDHLKSYRPFFFHLFYFFIYAASFFPKERERYLRKAGDFVSPRAALRFPFQKRPVTAVNQPPWVFAWPLSTLVLLYYTLYGFYISQHFILSSSTLHITVHFPAKHLRWDLMGFEHSLSLVFRHSRVGCLHLRREINS